MAKNLKSNQRGAPDRWVKIPGAEKIPPGEGDSFKVRGRRLAVFNLGGSWEAVADRCPHRGAPLGDGPVEGSVVTCTWHGWEFDLKKGCHVVEEDIRLEKFPVKKEKGFIFVQINNPNHNREA